MSIIFVTVLVDLLGFGMIIPLISIYGQHLGASATELAVLGSVFSVMQLIFGPVWGRLSDRFGRRPILLISLLGSTLSYAGFAMAQSYLFLLATRAFAGVFAANISTAQAYMADITKAEDRAKGMGLIGAAFGIGFMLGPPLGGITAYHYGVSSPGWIAAAICGLNLIAAFFRLKESLPKHLRERSETASEKVAVKEVKSEKLKSLIWIFFFVTFAFSMMEQTLSLLIKFRLEVETTDAMRKMGFVLMFSSFIGAMIQGRAIKPMVKRWGEYSLLLYGLLFCSVGYLLIPFAGQYAHFYIVMLPLTIGSSIVNPSLSALISKSASDRVQGATFGITQSAGAAARAAGPFVGLLAFHWVTHLPYLLAAGIAVLMAGLALKVKKRSSLDQGEGGKE